MLFNYLWQSFYILFSCMKAVKIQNNQDRLI